MRTGAGWQRRHRNTLIRFPPKNSVRNALLVSPCTTWRKGSISIVNFKPSSSPRRGDIWTANTGGKRHAMVILSLDNRNVSDRSDSVLAVPFGSFGRPGPPGLNMTPREKGVPADFYFKA